MSGLWRSLDNHDIGELYGMVRDQYPKDFVLGIYHYSHNDTWYLKFESGWHIGTFETLDVAISYAVEKYYEHIRMV